MIKASQYLEIPSSDTVIWRYMDFVTFCSLLTTGKIFFRRLDKYSDELEGTLPPKTKEELLKYRSAFDYSSSEGTEKWAAGVIENVEAYKEWTVANAWTISDVENYAMWKIYLRGNREGVAIKSTVGRLKESFTANGFEIYLGKVHYEGLKQEELNVYSVSTNKSSPYEFEKELRALILYQFTIPDDCDNTNRRIPKHEVGVEVPLNLSCLVEEIFISPFADTWFSHLITSIIRQFSTFEPEKYLHKSEIKDR